MSAAVARPLNGKKFKKAELKAIIGADSFEALLIVLLPLFWITMTAHSFLSAVHHTAGWGMKNKGLQDEWTADTVRLALRCNVPTVLLQLPAGVGRDAEEGSPEAAALGAVYALGGDNDLPAVQMLLRSGTKQVQHSAVRDVQCETRAPATAF